MSIKVIAIKQELSNTKIFYLNLLEPKNQQLFMAVFEKGLLSALTLYNTLTNQYEEITSLFPESFLKNLSEQIYIQINTKSHKEENDGFKLKSIL